MTLSNTHNEIIVELRQTRLAHLHNSLVLLEGRTDEALWIEYKANNCNLFPVGGKQHVLNIIQAVNDRTSLKGVAAIVDPDYWLVEHSEFLKTDNLLFDNLPDLEVMLIESPALEKILRHTLSITNIDKFVRKLRNDAVAIATEYGYFRLIDARHPEYGLSFNNVTFGDAIDGQSRMLRYELVAQLLTQNATVTQHDLLKELVELRSEVPPRIDLCRGKDILAILAQFLNSNSSLSGRAKVQTTSNELSRTLRMGYEFTYFITTQLYARIRDWETANMPYRIIQDLPLERTSP